MSNEPVDAHPAPWPEALTPVFDRFKTAEFTSLTPSGQPITYPLTPYLCADGLALEVSTGLTYPAKADRVRTQPKVSLLYSEPMGSGIAGAPTILVLGHGIVQSADLQANTDRFIRSSIAKNPEANRSMTPRLVARLGWYFVRLYVRVVPQDIYWWPAGQSDAPPEHWHATALGELPTSDPPPAGKSPPPWAAKPGDWHKSAAHAVQHLGLPVVTSLNADGYPIATRATGMRLTPEGFTLDLPKGALAPPTGRACLTFHIHSETFLSQENMTFIGTAHAEETTVQFRVSRRLGNWSLRGGGLRAAWDFLGKGRFLRKRLAQEAARYGQPVPVVRLPQPDKS